MPTSQYIQRLAISDSTLSRSPEPDLFGGQAVARSGSTRGSQQSPPEVAISDKLRAAVNAGALLSFVDGVSPQERDDVLYSTQLAHRAATARFNQLTQTKSWYGQYVEVLQRLGWVAEQVGFAEYAQSEGEVRMDKAALAIIAAIATQNQLLVLQEAVKALEAAAQDDRAILLFDFHTRTGGSGNFQIGAAQKSENGALSLALGAFHFESGDARRRFLFFAWGANQVQFWTAAQKLTLNGSLYAENRDAVRHKLGESAKEFLAGLSLE